MPLLDFRKQRVDPCLERQIARVLSNTWIAGGLVVLSLGLFVSLAASLTEEWRGLEPHFHGHSWVLGLFVTACALVLAFRVWTLASDQDRWSVPKRVAIAIVGTGLPWMIGVVFAVLLYGPQEVWDGLMGLVP